MVEGAFEGFDAADAARRLVPPRADDDKYTRGVLGVLTGSDRFPGAAVLGVEGAARTGVGMLRYVGPARPADLVLRRRPETVTADGRVQAWLIGSGMPPERDADLQHRIEGYLGQGVPVALDAGALDLAHRAAGPVVLTPHHGELVPVLRSLGHDVDRRAVAAEPGRWAATAAAALRVTVLLKGDTTLIADADGPRLAVRSGTAWLATAGSGDVLGGVLGALLAANSAAIADDPTLLAEVAAAAAWLHGEAGRRASGGGPIVALDIAEALPATVADVLARHRTSSSDS